MAFVVNSAAASVGSTATYASPAAPVVPPAGGTPPASSLDQSVSSYSAPTPGAATGQPQPLDLSTYVASSKEAGLAAISSGRVPMDKGSKMNLAQAGYRRVSEMPRQRLLSFLSEEMTRLVAPVRVTHDWSVARKGKNPSVTLNPADPRRPGKAAAAEACFLPLEPSQRFTELSVVGTRGGDTTEGNLLRDFVTGAPRPVHSGDGAYGAAFLVCDDGRLIAANSEKRELGKNVGQFEGGGKEVSFRLDSDNAHRVVGVVLMNVSNPSRQGIAGAGRTSAIKLNAMRATASKAELPPYQPLGLSESLAQIFARAAKTAFGESSAAQIRATIEAEFSAKFATPAMTELVLSCAPLAVLVDDLLRGPFGKNEDCSTPGDVVFRLLSSENKQAGAHDGFGMNLSSDTPVSLEAEVSLPPTFDPDGFRRAVDENLSTQLLVALGYPADADLSVLCTESKFLKELFVGLKAAGYSPLSKFLHIFSGSASQSVRLDAETEYIDIREVIRRARGHKAATIKTPSAFMRTMFPRTREDLERAGVICKTDAKGRALALLSRSTAQENVLLQIPHGRLYMGKFTNQKEAEVAGTWEKAISDHTSGSFATAVNSPFTSWSSGTGAMNFARDGSNVAFAELPAEEVIVNLFGLPGETEILSTANSPATIRMVVGHKVQISSAAGQKDLRQKFVTGIQERLQVAGPLPPEEARELIGAGSLLYLRDAELVACPTYSVEGTGDEHVIRLLAEESSKTRLDPLLTRRGLRRTESLPNTIVSHPELGTLTPSSPLPHVEYGVPFTLAPMTFADSKGRNWVLPVAATRKSGLMLLREEERAQATKTAPSLSPDELAAQPVGARVQAFVGHRVLQDLGLEAAQVTMTTNGGLVIGPALPPERAAKGRAALQFIVDALLGAHLNAERLERGGVRETLPAGFVAASGKLSAKGWSPDIDLEQFKRQVPSTAPYYAELASLTPEELLAALEEAKEGGIVSSFGAAAEHALSLQTRADLGNKRADTVRYELVTRLQARLSSLETELRKPSLPTGGGARLEGLHRIDSGVEGGLLDGRYRDAMGIEYRLEEQEASRVLAALANAALRRQSGLPAPKVHAVEMSGKACLLTESRPGEEEVAAPGTPSQVGAALTKLPPDSPVRRQLIDGLLIDLVTGSFESGAQLSANAKVPRFLVEESAAVDPASPTVDLAAELERVREATQGQHPLFNTPLEQVRERVERLLGSIAPEGLGVPQPADMRKRIEAVRDTAWSMVQTKPVVDWL